MLHSITCLLCSLTISQFANPDFTQPISEVVDEVIQNCPIDVRRPLYKVSYRSLRWQGACLWWPSVNKLCQIELLFLKYFAVFKTCFDYTCTYYTVCYLTFRPVSESVQTSVICDLTIFDCLLLISKQISMDTPNSFTSLFLVEHFMFKLVFKSVCLKWWVSLSLVISRVPALCRSLDLYW